MMHGVFEILGKIKYGTKRITLENNHKISNGLHLFIKERLTFRHF